jgi:nicotinic acid mononucleotide adenylyltransferase
VIYVCILIALKDDKGEEITRLIDAQRILRIVEATHRDAQADRVQMTPTVDPWGYATMGWVKKRLTEKYQAMRGNGKMMVTDKEIKSRAVQTTRLI